MAELLAMVPNWSKTAIQHIVGNDGVLSEWQRGTSPVSVMGKKYSLVMASMDRLTNLYHDFAVLNCTAAVEGSLPGCVLDHNVVGCMHYVGCSLASGPNKVK